MKYVSGASSNPTFYATSGVCHDEISIGPPPSGVLVLCVSTLEKDVARLSEAIGMAEAAADRLVGSEPENSTNEKPVESYGDHISGRLSALDYELRSRINRLTNALERIIKAV